MLPKVIHHSDPKKLYEASSYVLAGKGKRFRPQLVLSAADIFDGDRKLALQVAAAVEVFHVFTLVHDDIMDKSPERRGRETVHLKWDESTAILTGDYLLGLSGQLLLDYPEATLRGALNRYSDMIRILCEGQVRDMEFESRSDVKLNEYLKMIDQKTSALLQSSLVLGAMTGEATEDDLSLLDEIGYDLGRAFQIQDDLLDLVADSPKWGKPVGGDLIAGKKTFLLLQAVQEESGLAAGFFREIMSSGKMAPDLLGVAKRKMDDLGVTDFARSTITLHSDRAQENIARLPAAMGRDALSVLTDKMRSRLH